MVEASDVAMVVAAVHRDDEINPAGALALGLAVDLSLAVDRLAAGLGTPGHAEEQAAVIVLLEGDIAAALSEPVGVKGRILAVMVVGPALGLDEQRLAVVVEPLVAGPPGGGLVAEDLGGLRVGRGEGGIEAAEAGGAAAVEAVAAVDLEEPEVEAGLGRVMRGAELGEHAVAIRGEDRMEVGASGLGRVEDKQGLGAEALAGDGQGLAVDAARLAGQVLSEQGEGEREPDGRSRLGVGVVGPELFLV